MLHHPWYCPRPFQRCIVSEDPVRLLTLSFLKDCSFKKLNSYHYKRVPYLSILFQIQSFTIQCKTYTTWNPAPSYKFTFTTIQTRTLSSNVLVERHRQHGNLTLHSSFLFFLLGLSHVSPSLLTLKGSQKLISTSLGRLTPLLPMFCFLLHVRHKPRADYKNLVHLLFNLKILNLNKFRFNSYRKNHVSIYPETELSQ